MQEKVELWGGMSQKYLSLGMMDEARQYLSLAADNRPNELPLRMSLFMLALDANDDAGMKEAQEKILEIVKDRNDSNFLYHRGPPQAFTVAARRGRQGSHQ